MIAIASSCFWVRLIFMLMLTSTFGPLLTILVNMFKDLAIFFVLFTIELVAFASIGLLCF